MGGGGAQAILWKQVWGEAAFCTEVNFYGYNICGDKQKTHTKRATRRTDGAAATANLSLFLTVFSNIVSKSQTGPLRTRSSSGAGFKRHDSGQLPALLCAFGFHRQKTCQKTSTPLTINARPWSWCHKLICWWCCCCHPRLPSPGTIKDQWD